MTITLDRPDVRALVDGLRKNGSQYGERPGWHRSAPEPRPTGEVRPMSESTPCEVCGMPTRSKYGACQRTRECRALHNRRYVRGSAKLQPPCEVCGKPTWSEYRVCVRTQACYNERARREWAAGDPEALRERHSRYYWANAESQREHKRQERLANPELLRERQRGYREANPERYREKAKRHRHARLEADPAGERARLAAAARRYRQKPGRPCRYAKAGCTEFALIGRSACREHDIADRKLRYERRRDRLTIRLAAAQGGVCTWCGEALPQNLTERLSVNRMAVEIDHVIPKTVSMRAIGRVIEDEWNLRALHWQCNGAAGKFTRLTPEAIALAKEHGITLEEA